ncbi:glycosyltransferase [Desulfolucanica intricata]|uniref:glycosyltransferase n=1 Tax=Desulfolucanica intricata TaxID=1285191 RepID=UPI00082CB478|nr:glycosyltransferase [Desulfolucanica intricata]
MKGREMVNPIISIVVPVYNVEQYLDRCVNSLINQTFKDIEIILVDDGSTDNSPKLCDEYARQDNRIKVIHKKNGGLSDSRNMGIHYAKGEYILFVDSDDYIENDTCEKFANIVSEQEVDIVIGGAKKITSSEVKKMLPSTSLYNSVLSGSDYLKHELKHNCAKMAACLNLYRRKFLLENNLFFKIGLLHEDEQWTPRVFLAASKVLVSDNCFYNYVIREDSITKTKDFSKNAIHIVSIVAELSDFYEKLDDKELKNLLKDYLIGIYLFAYRKGDLCKHGKKYTFKKYVLINSRSFSNRIKAIIFLISPKLYTTLSNLRS